MEELITITKDQIEIRCPIFWGLLIRAKQIFLYLNLGGIIFAIIIILLFSDLTPKIWYIVGMILYVNLLAMIFYVASKIYYKTSHAKVIINKQEIALYKRSIKKKTIKIDDIDKFVFYSKDILSGFMDDYIIHSKRKVRIRFCAPSSLIEKIEQLTGRKINLPGDKQESD